MVDNITTFLISKAQVALLFMAGFLIGYGLHSFIRQEAVNSLLMLLGLFIILVLSFYKVIIKPKEEPNNGTVSSNINN